MWCKIGYYYSWFNKVTYYSISVQKEECSDCATGFPTAAKLNSPLRSHARYHYSVNLSTEFAR
jgi:hypothetical protein